MHDEAIQCITDIIDYCLSTTLDPVKARILLCGDFHNLRFLSDEISRITNMKQIVDFPTRADNTLDLIFTHFASDVSPSRLSLIANSDHVCIFFGPLSLLSIHSLKDEPKSFLNQIWHPIITIGALGGKYDCYF